MPGFNGVLTPIGHGRSTIAAREPRLSVCQLRLGGGGKGGHWIQRAPPGLVDACFMACVVETITS